MIDVRKLEHWRRPDLEALVFKGHEGEPGNIAGDIVLGPASDRKSVRFSIEQNDDILGHPYVCLSAEEHTRCRDRDVARFLKFAGLTAIEEISPQTKGTCVRSFILKDEA